MTNANSDDFELELVQVLFRHGDRTPSLSEVYPNDPDKSFEYPPYGHGQLTVEGEKRAFKIGETLRNRYGAFIGQYESETVYAYSTCPERCKKTLRLVLTALFPPEPDLTWCENINCVSIPFECNSYDEEMFYAALRHPNFQDIMNETYNSSEIQEMTEELNEMMDYVCEKTGLQRSLEAIALLFQNFTSKKGLGLPLPDWCDDKLFQDLKKGIEFFFIAFWHNDEFKKLFMGQFLKKVAENIHDNIHKRSAKKIYLYSAHDVTVYTFLRAHNIDHIRYIHYGATVVLEKLRGKDNKQYVRLLFWSGDGDQFETLKLKDCDEMCPFEKYLEIVNPLLSNDTE